jgi:D-inositol-3-phosphate glycosyltransferase
MRRGILADTSGKLRPRNYAVSVSVPVCAGQDLRGASSQSTPTPTGVTLLTGGFDRPYALGLARALLVKGTRLDVIGSDELDSPEMRGRESLHFFNLHGSLKARESVTMRTSRWLIFYVRLIRYALSAEPRIFHVLWNNKAQMFDRTLLMLYYKLLGKKIVLTAHNVNAGKRDSNDSWLNRLTLRVQYRLVDHIFVHTEKMKSELVQEFGVQGRKVTVIPFGINNSVPDSGITAAEAKRKLGIGSATKAILFFGNIGPYKGVDVLVSAFQNLATSDEEYRLIIAGKPRGGCEEYLERIQESINRHVTRSHIIQKIGYIPDEEVELYFKAADILVLPYKEISQSGVLVLAYSFGLPVIAADVGSLRDDIMEGETGFLFKPCNHADLAQSIKMYFDSDLFRNLSLRRRKIRNYANQRYSWSTVGDMTLKVYEDVLVRKSS